jgi:uncharacterized membrane protein
MNGLPSSKKSSFRYGQIGERGWRKPASPRFKGGLCLAVALLCVSLVTPASARDWRIAQFYSRISVAQDGTSAVTERIDLVFVGLYHGIYRDIPIEYPGPHGSNYTLFLKVTGVTDGEGNKLKYESSTQNGSRHLKIYIPAAEDTTRTVLIHYTVRNGVRWFDDHDEFYWNVTGNDWPVPIDAASVTISFPPKAAGELRAQAFTGAYGSQERDAAVQVRGDMVTIASNNPLSMREGLTADVYISKGVLTQPSKLTQAMWFLRSNIVVLLPLWAFLVMFFLWWSKGRDPKPDSSVAPMYEPPKGMTPAEVGTLVDDAVHPRDITSTLVDLAVKGYLKIEEKEARVLLFSHRDYVFHLLKPQSEWASLEAHERVILNHMFGGGEPQIRLSDLRNQFYVAIPTIKEDILAELKNKGMYSVDPESAHAYVLLGVLLTAAPFILLQVFGAASILDSPGLLIATAVLAILIIFLFARIMTAKSLKGVRTKVEILGFQEFVNRVDADRLKRMPPDTFEKFLPYAMALGIEHRWAKAFQGIVQNPPTWYVGPTPYMAFNPIFFAGSMHNLASDAHQAFVAAPRASSTGSGWGGGGFGGGGFSGGGFGGGGGGAF